MKLKRVETFITSQKVDFNCRYYYDKDFNNLMNYTIGQYENNGFELTNITKEFKDELIFICFEFTKELIDEK